MEAVVSLLILGILMTTIVSIIRFSTVITGNSLSNADNAQELSNRLITEDYPADSISELNFSFTKNEPGTPEIFIETKHDVAFYQEEGLIAFHPVTGSGEAP